MKKMFFTFAAAMISMLSFGQVVISEIHFNPCPDQGPDGGYEFIEFYNMGAGGTVNLSGCEITGVDFVFPEGTTIDPFEFIVVARRSFKYSDLECQLFDWPNDKWLHNTADVVELVDNGDVMCSVSYTAQAGDAWPDEADSGCYSLELGNAMDGVNAPNDPTSYVTHTYFGSPGRYHMFDNPTIDTPAGTRTLCQNFKADYLGAEMYTFVFTSQTDGSQTLHTSTGNTSIQLRDVGLNVNTTYDVTVDAYKDGYWVVGETSTELTIEAQTVSVDASTSCANGSIYLGDYIKANPFVCGGDHWKWTFREVGVAGFPIVHTTNSSNRYLQLEDVVGLNEGTTYEVFVAAVYQDGTETAPSAPQCIEINGNAVVDLPLSSDNPFADFEEETIPMAMAQGGGSDPAGQTLSFTFYDCWDTSLPNAELTFTFDDGSNVATLVSQTATLPTDWTYTYDPFDAQLYLQSSVVNEVGDYYEILGYTTFGYDDFQLAYVENEIAVLNLIGCDGEWSWVPTAGCTNDAACNYDASADTDDGSCEFDEFTPFTTGNWTLAFFIDCVDGSGGSEVAIVYNDDNTYEIPTEGNEGYWSVCDGTYLHVYSTGLVYAGNYDASTNTISGQTFDSVDDFLNGGTAGWCFTIYSDQVVGCTDATACNYNENADTDNGSCEYGLWYLPEVNNDGNTALQLCEGDVVPDGYTLAEYQDCVQTVTEDDSWCINTSWDQICQNQYDACIPVEGCTDATACNYNEAANTDDGSCEFTSCVGCTDETACNYNETATTDDGSCEFTSCAGCTDATACNYDETATIDDGSCVFAEEFLNCEGECLNDTDDDGVCDEFEVVGCTDETACNYNPLATDSGTCEYPTIEVVVTDGEYPSEVSWSILPLDGEVTEPLLTGVTGVTTSCDVVLEAGCYQFAMYDSFGDGWNGAEFTLTIDGVETATGTLTEEQGDFGVVIFGVDSECVFEGCTNPIACNYDPTANVEDGSCITYSDSPVDMFNTEFLLLNEGAVVDTVTFTVEYQLLDADGQPAVDDNDVPLTWSVCGDTLTISSGLVMTWDGSEWSYVDELNDLVIVPVDTWLSVEDILPTEREGNLVKIVNTLGQVIDADTQGLQIHIYDNGTTKKVYRR